MSLSPEDRQAIRQAFRSGQLKVEGALHSGLVQWHTVTDVMCHEVPHKKAFEVELEGDRKVIATEDHSLFWYEGGWFGEVQTGKLKKGMTAAIVHEGRVRPCKVVSCKQVESQRFMYDLSVPGPQNFVLSNGILAHNSYSIGGISLDINKSSSYETLKQNAESQLDKATAAKQLTVKIIRGLAQPRFGMGVRSSFGPYTANGSTGPRSFVG